ncbi:hypothetical protein EVAR_76631_1 [Eumeta japonica]|uniref:Uncharacterized protein n=1 Tax=Eumeta variegata TaxID=151549 RepID=A0A4C1T890_EUMVA|nr:hypothetical protein EVAR_76631_1 [Eumeta japonica]
MHSRQQSAQVTRSLARARGPPPPAARRPPPAARLRADVSLIMLYRRFGKPTAVEARLDSVTHPGDVVEMKNRKIYEILCDTKDPAFEHQSVLRGRPIIVEWERDARHSAGLSRSVTHRYVTERYTFHNGVGSGAERGVRAAEPARRGRGPLSSAALSQQMYRRKGSHFLRDTCASLPTPELGYGGGTSRNALSRIRFNWKCV